MVRFTKTGADHHRYKKSELPLLDNRDIGILISEDENVINHKLSIEQINAVLYAYSEIIKNALDMGLMISLPKLGWFYPKTCTYSGGAQKMAKFEGRKFRSHITKKIAFKVKESIQESFAEKFKTYYDDYDSDEFRDALKEYNRFKTLEEIYEEYYSESETMSDEIWQ